MESVSVVSEVEPVFMGSDEVNGSQTVEKQIGA